MKKILLLLFLIPNLVIAKSFLCIAENSAGISQNYGKGSFTSEIYRATNKYIVKKINNNWNVKRFGDDDKFLNLCEKPLPSKDGKLLECNAYFGRFTMSIDKLRFVHTRNGDWTNSEGIFWGKGLVEYGSCSSI